MPVGDRLQTFLTGALAGQQGRQAQAAQQQQQGFENRLRTDQLGLQQEQFGIRQEQFELSQRQFDRAQKEYEKALDDESLARDARPKALALIGRARQDPAFLQGLSEDAEAMEIITRAKLQGEFINSFPDPNKTGARGTRFKVAGGIIYDLFAPPDEQGNLIAVTPPKPGREDYQTALRRWTTIFQEGGVVEPDDAIKRATDFLAPIYAEPIAARAEPPEIPIGVTPPASSEQTAEITAGNAAAEADGQEKAPAGAQYVWIPELGDYALFDASLGLDEINAELQERGLGRILTRQRGQQEKPQAFRPVEISTPRGTTDFGGRAGAVRNLAEQVLNPPFSRIKTNEAEPRGAEPRRVKPRRVSR